MPLPPLTPHRRSPPELDAAVWLRRLSHDPAPSVRAAAARAVYEWGVDLTDRLEQMVRSDPSATVVAQARYYLLKASKQTE